MTTTQHTASTTTTHRTHDWYTVVSFGGAFQRQMPPVGPWHGAEAAEEALGDWVWRMAAEGGSIMAATHAQVVGPFCTRQRARDTDISDWPQRVCRHDSASA